MDQGKNIIPISVAFLTYNPERNVNKPFVKLDNNCIVGLYDLIKHKDIKENEKHKMGIDAYNHYKWYNLCLRIELNKIEKNGKLKITHWYIESGNSDAFKKEDVMYNIVSFIIGPIIEQWYYANTSGKHANSINGCNIRNEKTLLAMNNIRTIPGPNLCKNELCTNNNTYNNCKCTIDYCAFNCAKCKKYLTPFGKLKTLKCACYIGTNFQKIIEENEDDIIN